MFTVDLIQWRFEERPTGWPRDPYQFMQWRPDDDLFQNCVISCEYLFLCIFLFTVVSRHLYITCIISCDHLMYFTSMTTRITSWDIANVYFYIIVNYCYLLFNYYHVMILFILVSYCSWPCSLRWNLYLSSSVWDWIVPDKLSTGYWVSHSVVDTWTN